MIVVNFNDQAIKPYDRINSLKRPVAPLLDLFIDDISDFLDQRRRHIYVVQVL